MDKVQEGVVVWSIVGSSIGMMAAIMFFSFRDLLKYDQKYLSVLKDPSTVFFLAFALLALALKLILLETYTLNELYNR